MSAFTKRAIMQAFLHLLEKKPFEKITVRDVVDECGVNRNTFYYYFRDIYAMLEELCGYAVKQLPQGGTLADTAATFVGVLSDFSCRFPKATRNLILSLGRDGLERCFCDGLDGVLLKCLIEDVGIDTNRRERVTLTVSLLRHALLGITFDLVKQEKHQKGEAAAVVRGLLDGMSFAYLSEQV